MLQDRHSLRWTIDQDNLTEEQLLLAVIQLVACGAEIDDTVGSQVIILLVMICVLTS